MITVGSFVVLREGEPIRLGDRAIPILLRTGWAFGDGSHSSTRGMLEALSHHVVRGMRVLDFGTGTGILAMAAAKLGATVVATEADLSAWREASANVSLNGLGSTVTVLRTAGEVPDGDYDLILANLGSSDVLRKIAGHAPRVLFTDDDDEPTCSFSNDRSGN